MKKTLLIASVIAIFSAPTVFAFSEQKIDNFFLQRISKKSASEKAAAKKAAAKKAAYEKITKQIASFSKSGLQGVWGVMGQ